MKTMIFISLLWSLSANSATTITSTIYDIELSKDQKEPHLIYFDDGHAAFLPAQNKSLLTQLMLSYEQGAIVATVNDQNEIQSFKIKNSNSAGDAAEETLDFPLENKTFYDPTVFSSAAEAQSIFITMNSNHRSRSQCYNRAHVWAWEGNQRYKINWMKVFMLFTSKYIREYSYDWWFHVSPFVYVNEGGTLVERVMDHAFTGGPTDMKRWSDYFISPKTPCTVVSKYSDYRNHQWDAYCYHIKVTQFYWQPRDIENEELTGYQKTEFIQGEVNAAYRQGF